MNQQEDELIKEWEAIYIPKDEKEVRLNQLTNALSYCPKPDIALYELKFDCFEISQLNGGQTPFSKFIKKRCETRTRSLLQEYCAMNLGLYHHPKQNSKRKLNQMVRGYLGPYRTCKRCNYHFWNRNEYHKHNKLCTTEIKFILRQPYRFAAIERTPGYDLFICFFCSTPRSFKNEQGFAVHCYQDHKSELHYIGLNEWECYRVAYNRLPPDVQPRKYKRKELNTIDQLFGDVKHDDDEQNQQEVTQNEQQSGQQQGLTQAINNLDGKNNNPKIQISIFTPNTSKFDQQKLKFGATNTTEYQQLGQTPITNLIHSSVQPQFASTLRPTYWFEQPNITTLSTLSSFTNPYFHYLMNTANMINTLECGCYSEAASQKFKFFTINNECHYMFGYPINLLTNNNDACERCIKVYNNTKQAIGDQNLSYQTPAAVGLFKTDYNILICIRLHQDSKKLVNWITNADPNAMENLIMKMKGRISTLKSLNIMQGAVHLKNIYVHEVQQQSEPYFVDWSNLKQFSLEQQVYMHPLVSPQYRLPLAIVNNNNDLYSLLWVIADINHCKHNQCKDENDVPSNWLENSSKMNDWASNSNRRGSIVIPSFIKKFSLSPNDRGLFTARTFEEVLAFFTSFDGSSSQLMQHQAEYYQFAIKFLNDKEYTSVISKVVEVVVSKTEAGPENTPKETNETK